MELMDRLLTQDQLISMNIQYLKDTLNKGVYNKTDESWKEAFSEYNKNNSPKLGMGCMACYRKVLIYINQKYKP